MKAPDDTGFYCYRAIEALRQYCIVRYNLDSEKKSEQWRKVREIAGCEEQILHDIKSAADPVRHGAIVPVTSGRSRNPVYQNMGTLLMASLRTSNQSLEPTVAVKIHG